MGRVIRNPKQMIPLDLQNEPQSNRIVLKNRSVPMYINTKNQNGIHNEQFYLFFSPLITVTSNE